MDSFNQHPYSRSFREPSQNQKLKYSLSMTPEDHLLLYDEITGLSDNLNRTLAISASETIGHSGFINNKGDQLRFATQHARNRLAKCALTLVDTNLMIDHKLELSKHASGRSFWQYKQHHRLDNNLVKNYTLNHTDVVAIVSSYVDKMPGFMNKMLDRNNINEADVLYLVTNIDDEFGFEETFNEKSRKARRLLVEDDPLSSYDAHLLEHRSNDITRHELTVSTPLSLAENRDFFESIRQAYRVRYDKDSSSAPFGEAQHIMSPNAPISDTTIIKKMKETFYQKKQINSNPSSSESHRLIFSKGLGEIAKNQKSELDSL